LRADDVPWNNFEPDIVFMGAGGFTMNFLTNSTNTGQEPDVPSRDKADQRLQTIQDVQHQFFQNVDASTLFQGILDNLLQLTDSEYGFIGEIFQTEAGAPYLKTHAITNIAWSAETRAFYEDNIATGLEFYNVDTLFGRVMTTGEAVIANEPSEDSRSGGLPPGHPDLNAFLGLPLHRGNDLIGMAGIANRPGGYDDDIIEYIQPVTTTCSTMVHAYQDEREKDRYHLSLRESEERMRAILETAVDCFITIKTSGVIESVNRAAEKMFGYSSQEMVGKNVSMLMPEPYANSHDEYLKKYLETGVGKIIGIGREVVGLRKDGSTFPADLAVSEVHMDDGLRFTGVVRDITDRKHAEEERQEMLTLLTVSNKALEDLNVRLKQSNKELDEFAHVASHDLQEPLRKIQAFGDRLIATCGDDLSAKGQDYLRRMHVAAGRMQCFVRDLLTISRVATHTEPFETVKLNSLIIEVISDLEISIAETGAQIIVDTLPDVYADPTQMRQLFQNLLSNALKYHKPGEDPVVHIATVEEGTDTNTEDTGGMCQISISDEGIGFDEKHVDRIFAVFQRLHGRSQYEGTGVGLALCRKIAQRHDGDITVRSQPGQGATFTIHLPAARP
jgi:two-component system sensor kinase FixL